MFILGISAYYHDSAAALIEDERIVAAAQEERFTRKKHDASFPGNAVSYCLKEAGIGLNEVDRIMFYDSPVLKFKRIVKTYVDFFPQSVPLICRSLPRWLGSRLYWKRNLQRALFEWFGVMVPGGRIGNHLHHGSHAASAFYPSPFDEAAILVMDGVGEFATTSISHGRQNRITPLWQIDFPHSLGLLYSAFTYYTGFKVNSGEYKVMGLAPYGRPLYADRIKDRLIEIKDDGRFTLNMEYFNYAVGRTMTNGKFEDLFGGAPRGPETLLTERDFDLASSIQQITEEVMLKLARTAQKETGSRNLCLAGGVALNCVANGKILRDGAFDDIWIQPAAGDAGGALGVALHAYYQEMGNHRAVHRTTGDRMQGSYLGPHYDDDEVERHLKSVGAVYRRVSESELLDIVSDALAQGSIVGWHQGRMEFGPRALGARSILGDARNPKMQSVMNLKIKYRESFRPFAPSVLAEHVSDYFDFAGSSPYMLLVAPVNDEIRIPMTPDQKGLFGIEKLNVPRSSIPAATHVDYSARIQTVHRQTNPRYYDLIGRFREKTGCAVIVNTSFNVRGEPIVRTPEESYRCFMRTEIDILAMENFILQKRDQPKYQDSGDWRKEFELD